MNNKTAKSLYNIEQEYLELLDSIEENEGVLTEEQEQALIVKEEEFAKKMEAYGHKIKFLKGEIETIKDEKKRFDAAIKAKTTLIDNLKERIVHALTLFGEDTKSGGKRYKSDTLNMFTVDKDQVDMLEDDIENFGDYGITNIDLNLNSKQLNEVLSFISDKFGQDKVSQKGCKLQSKKFLDAVKSGIIVKKLYFFDDNGNELPEGEQSDNYKDIYTDVHTGEKYSYLDVVINTTLSSR